MYKNQLQELAQRSCFNLPSYACIREGPDHAPRFKASVNFNGEIFQGPSNCSTLRQAEHAAAEVALNTLSTRGPSVFLIARVFDETGVYKNLLQETSHRAGLNLPVYTIVRSGPAHLPVFTSSVELAGRNFTGPPAKTKKQAEKNAAMEAWSALKQLRILGSLSQHKEPETSEEQEQLEIARVLSTLNHKNDRKPARQRIVLLDVPHKAASCKKWRPVDLLRDAPVHPPLWTTPLGPRTPPHVPAFNHSTAPHRDPSSSIEKNHLLLSFNRPSPVKMQETPPSLKEHSENEEADRHRKAAQSHWQGASFTPKSASANLPRIGFQPHAMAPAVNIRSVIPVCAAMQRKKEPLPPLSAQREDEISKLNRLRL